VEGSKKIKREKRQVKLHHHVKEKEGSKAEKSLVLTGALRSGEESVHASKSAKGRGRRACSGPLEMEEKERAKHRGKRNYSEQGERARSETRSPAEVVGRSEKKDHRQAEEIKD